MVRVSECADAVDSLDLNWRGSFSQRGRPNCGAKKTEMMHRRINCDLSARPQCDNAIPPVRIDEMHAK
jgi:hypothetical protein